MLEGYVKTLKLKFYPQQEMQHKVIHKLPKSVLVNDIQLRNGLQTDYYKVSNPQLSENFTVYPNVVHKTFHGTNKLHDCIQYLIVQLHVTTNSLQVMLRPCYTKQFSLMIIGSSLDMLTVQLFKLL